MKKIYYQAPCIEAVAIHTERGFALSGEIDDWGNSGEDHGGDAE